MNNLLNSTNIATLFLDSRLCIERYTDEIKSIVHLIPADLGRSNWDLKSHLWYDDPLSDAEQVLKTLIPKEREVQNDDDQWWLMRILPYRTSQDRIEGLVMTFVDINESKRIDMDANALMENVVATVREPLLVLDHQLRVRFANRSFYEVFQVTAQDTEEQSVYELGSKQWDLPELRYLLQELLIRDCKFDDFKVECEFPKV